MMTELEAWDKARETGGHPYYCQKRETWVTVEEMYPGGIITVHGKRESQLWENLGAFKKQNFLRRLK